MKQMALLLCLALGLINAGCGGGSGGGSSSTAGAIAGALSVPPSNKLETEPNNNIGGAQAVDAGDSINGAGAVTDSGSSVAVGGGSALVQDFYRLTVPAGESAQITLTLAADDISVNDLDLFLMDSAGSLITASLGENSAVEVVTAAGGATYIVGVNAFAGASAYLLAFATSTTAAAAGDQVIPVGAEIVPGEVLLKLKPTNKDFAQASGARVQHWRLNTDSSTLRRCHWAYSS